MLSPELRKKLHDVDSISLSVPISETEEKIARIINGLKALSKQVKEGLPQQNSPEEVAESSNLPQQNSLKSLEAELGTASPGKLEVRQENLLESLKAHKAKESSLNTQLEAKNELHTPAEEEKYPFKAAITKTELLARAQEASFKGVPPKAISSSTSDPHISSHEYEKMRNPTPYFGLPYADEPECQSALEKASRDTRLKTPSTHTDVRKTPEQFKFPVNEFASWSPNIKEIKLHCSTETLQDVQQHCFKASEPIGCPAAYPPVPPYGAMHNATPCYPKVCIPFASFTYASQQDCENALRPVCIPFTYASQQDCENALRLACIPCCPPDRAPLQGGCLYPTEW